MTISKFQGKTKEEAIEKAKKEFGPNAVIMNVKEIKPKGLFRAFGSSTFEVTAAMEEKEHYPVSSGTFPAAEPLKEKRAESISYTADEKIPLPAQTPRPEYRGIANDLEKKLERRQYTGHSSVKEQSIRNGKELEEMLEQKAMNFRNTTSAREVPTQARIMKEQQEENDKKLEERLDNLSSILEERFGVPVKKESAKKEPAAMNSEERNLIRMLYNTLMNNEVQERYVNQIMDEMEDLIRPGNSVDMILANVYQKLILRFGHPKTIEIQGKKPKVVFFIGPTGVGKTTTIAKIASKFKVEQNRKVAFVTADTYRIAATEQLRVYANILDAPMSIVYEASDLNSEVEKLKGYDIIFVDTAGFSHKNEKQREDIHSLIQDLDPAFEKEVFLVLSATTKYHDLLEIVDIYHKISDYKLIFTKLDETSCYGNMLNIKLYSGADLSYVTNGQNVPDDMEVFDTQKIVKQLLGGK